MSSGPLGPDAAATQRDWFAAVGGVVRDSFGSGGATSESQGATTGSGGDWSESHADTSGSGGDEVGLNAAAGQGDESTSASGVFAAGPDGAAGQRDWPLGTVVGFARALRSAGIAVEGERSQALVESLGCVDVASRAQVYWAGRLATCSSVDDIERYDRIFAAYWEGESVGMKKGDSTPIMHLVPSEDDSDEGEDSENSMEVGVAAALELLRHRDIADLHDRDRSLLNVLLAACSLPPQLRRSRRWRVAGLHGRVDPRRTARDVVRNGGEPSRLHRRKIAQRPRRVVLLVDVSGSMSPYADALLRFAHASVRARDGHGVPIEVFTLGTRLTRVTAALSHRDPDVAMQEVAALVPDWNGGTRLGVLLRQWMIEWGRRGMARGSIVVVLSDGWERGEVDTLAKAMESLALVANRVIWSNPRMGRAGFTPTAAGMAAALPYVTNLIEGHSVAALQYLAATIASPTPQPLPVGSRDPYRA